MKPSDETSADETLMPERLEFRWMTSAKNAKTASRESGDALTIALYMSNREDYVSEEHC